MLCDIFSGMKSREQVNYYVEFLITMTLKEIKARYKYAVLGFLWVILNPLLQMLIIGFVFQFFIPVKVDNYFLFLFSGLLPWNFFSYSLTKNTPMIVFERSLMKKAKFPRETIVLAIVLSNLFHFLISMFLLLLLLIIDKAVFEHYSAIQLLFYIIRLMIIVPITIWLTLLTSGLSLLFAALNVKYRDVNFAVQALLPLWFYATPIIYTLNLLPTKMQFLAYLNPMTSITQLFHFALLNIDLPNLWLTTIGLVVTVLMVAGGYLVFKKESPFFDDWV